jgi:putative toxin-antitoxin system antitoxin component (TIGR02293 family)
MPKENKTVKPARRKARVAAPVRNSKRRISGPEGSSAVTIATVRKGLSTAVLRTVAAHLEMTDRQLGGVLGISNRTLDRRIKHGVLSPEESDRLARVAKIFQRAREVFGDAEKARSWINTRLAAFDGETPLQRADTSLGANQVEDVLGRIDYGVYT